MELPSIAEGVLRARLHHRARVGDALGMRRQRGGAALLWWW